MTTTSKVAIVPTSGSIPECKPNLMPFHINYNGPAAVNAFMPVEKLLVDSEPQDTSIVSGISETQRLEATTSSDTLDVPPTLTRSTTESTLVTESSSTTLEGSTPDVFISSSSSFSQLPDNPEDLAPPIEDPNKRYVSTFRGRTIHGLTIDLPDGYAGVVLKATSDGRAGVSGSVRGDAQRVMDVDVDLEMESRGQRRRGRLRSSAAPRKGTVITISDDDNVPQTSDLLNEPSGDDVEMADPPNNLDGPLRILVPTARFDSLTLWQADRMVNKSNDEYWRTLSEWIGLAHEINKV